MARPRTPTAMKLLKGTAQKCRMNENEPDPGGDPVMPEYLDGEEREAWEYHVSLLGPMRVLTVSDAAALAAMCRTYVELQKARRLVRDEGQTIEGQRGMTKHPAVMIAADAEKRYFNWLGKFGLTPSDRSKVSARGREETNPWSEFVDRS